MTTSWTISVEDAHIQNSTFALQCKDDCYLSANTKLVAIDKAVLLSSEHLANLFRDAVMSIMQRRHGSEVTLHVRQHSSSAKRAVDDALVQARIDQKNFAPNKRPVMPDETVFPNKEEQELLNLFASCDERGRDLILISARVAATGSAERTDRPKCEVIEIF